MALPRPRGVAAGFQENVLASDFAAQYRPEKLPSLALKPSELNLLDRRKIDRACVRLNVRQQIGGPEVLQVRGLLHHVLTRQVIAALLVVSVSCTCALFTITPDFRGSKSRPLLVPATATLGAASLAANVAIVPIFQSTASRAAQSNHAATIGGIVLR